VKPDRIEREIVIAAPIERVWEVVTAPEHVGVWFGDGKPADIDLRPGGIMMLDHGEHGLFPTKIVTVEEPHRFSYRWASAFPGEQATEENSTLVEFRLTNDGDKTRLTVVETGFASLEIPLEREPTAGYDSHTAGWQEVTGNLARYAEQL
jgi:uncharacterized protein YndB with AHSA1/START domain